MRCLVFGAIAPDDSAVSESNQPAGTMHRDILSAYALTASRIFGWIVVSALVYRRLGAQAFALLTLVRSTVGLLSNTSLGLAPAMIAKLAQALHRKPVAAISVDADLPMLVEPMPELEGDLNIAAVYASGLTLAIAMASVGVALSLLYGGFFTHLHNVPEGYSAQTMFVMAAAMGAGITIRMIGDAPAAVLQTHRHIALDNWLMAAAETLWVVLSAVVVIQHESIAWIGVALLISNSALLIARLLAAHFIAGRIQFGQVRLPLMRALLAFGSLVAIAELADFLYAPTDYILINRLLTPQAVADYAPAVQFDGAILLMVSAIAEVLLPKTALAHHSGQRDLVRKYFFFGTAATTFILIFCAVGGYAIAPHIFKVWLGTKKLPETRAILPFVLIHTVIGGSSIVGRSILLGMGKVRVFTTAVILAGVSNVILSYCFVKFAGLGLRGIILGTIVAVVARCAIWQPWYVLRTLRRADEQTSRRHLA